MTTKQFEELKAQLQAKFSVEQYDDNVFYDFDSVEELKAAYDMVEEAYNENTGYFGWRFPRYMVLHKRDGQRYWSSCGSHDEPYFDMSKIAEEEGGIALCSIEEVRNHYYEALNEEPDEDDDHECQLFAREKETAEALIKMLEEAEEGRMLYCENEADQSYADAWELIDRYRLGYYHDTHTYLLALDLNNLAIYIDDEEDND
jgi:hypothetical protein